VLDINNPHGGSVWVIADLTEQKEAQNRLEYLDHHDPLTDLPNRLLFHDRLSHAIIRAARDREKLAILFLDLDHFKAINDSLGHYAGDRLLSAVAERLQKSLRESDTLARHGGDEFIILIEKITEDITIVSLAEKLLHQLAVPFDIGKHTFYITLSIGISLYPADGHDSSTLLRNADAAMHQAKARGRNAYHFYSEEITRNALERVEMEKQLRQAVKLNELEIHYQPQINAQNGHISGAEALVRWNHPERGLIPPSAFIPLAEETGIIQDLGYYVLEQSCNFWTELAQKGLTLPQIAVNLSVKQLHQDNLVQNICNLIKKTGIPPQALEIEITESFFLEPEKAFDLLFELWQLGLSLALDDFGIGYSSLNYLKQLPFRKLKIDQSFIRDIGRSSDGEVLVRTIISMARSLGREVLAEGVETRQQMDFLLEEGCPTMQGYFFAKPMPGGEFGNWLAKKLMVSPSDQASCL
ncbi:MAG: EAL domain-containing protein, partial [Desulfuromonadaceae bacterium]